MTFAPGRVKTGGRTRGKPNKRTILAEQRATGALDHLRKVMETADGTVTAELRVRAAVALAQYSTPKPVALRVLATPLNLSPPKDAKQARAQIGKVTAMIANGQIDSEIGRSIILGLQAFAGSLAAELEAEVEQLRASEGEQ